MSGLLAIVDRLDAELAAHRQQPLEPLPGLGVAGRRVGIQNGRRDERLMFAAIESYPGLFVQAIGDEPAARSVVCVRGCVQVCVSRTTAIRTIR